MDLAVMSKYEVGQTVRVRHHMGEWEGVITYKAHVDNDAQGQEMWEYEVSNSPVDNNARGFPMPEGAGYRWHPLLWEYEIEEVLD